MLGSDVGMASLLRFPLGEFDGPPSSRGVRHGAALVSLAALGLRDPASDGGESDAAGSECLRSRAMLGPQQPEKQVLCADLAVAEAHALFSRNLQHSGDEFVQLQRIPHKDPHRSSGKNNLVPADYERAGLPRSAGWAAGPALGH